MKLDLEQRNALIAQHMNLARSVVSRRKKENLYSVDSDDLLSAAYMGLVDAASRYDTDQGKFFGYALLRINGEVTDYLRSLGFGSKSTNSRGCERVDSIDSVNAETNTSIAQGLAAKKYEDVKFVFEEITETLTPQGRDVMWAYFVEGKKLKEIGEGLGLGESRVSQLISECRKQIKVAA